MREVGSAGDGRLRRRPRRPLVDVTKFLRRLAEAGPDSAALAHLPRAQEVVLSADAGERAPPTHAASRGHSTSRDTPLHAADALKPLGGRLSTSTLGNSGASGRVIRVETRRGLYSARQFSAPWPGVGSCKSLAVIYRRRRRTAGLGNESSRACTPCCASGSQSCRWSSSS